MAPARRTIECFFDGACKGNQFETKGPMWVAYVVGGEEHVREIPDLPSPRGPLRSNNIAEYEALILLLRRLRELRSRDPRSTFVISGDSQLVVYQMQSRYRVRQPHLMALHEEAARLASALPVAFRWVPRNHNPAGKLLETT